MVDMSTTTTSTQVTTQEILTREWTTTNWYSSATWKAISQSTKWVTQTASRTTDTGPDVTTEPGSKPSAIIIGVCIAVAAILLFLFFIICCCFKSKRCCCKKAGAKKMTPWKRLQKSYTKRLRRNQYETKMPDLTSVQEPIPELDKPKEIITSTERITPEGSEDHQKKSQEQELITYDALIGGSVRPTDSIIESSSNHPGAGTSSLKINNSPVLKKNNVHENDPYYNIITVPDAPYMSMHGAGNEKEVEYILKEDKKDPKYTNMTAFSTSQGAVNDGYVNANEDEEPYENTKLKLDEKEEYYNMQHVNNKTPTYLNNIVNVTDSIHGDSVAAQEDMEANYLGLQKEEPTVKEDLETYDVVDSYGKTFVPMHGSKQ